MFQSVFSLFFKSSHEDKAQKAQLAFTDRLKKIKFNFNDQPLPNCFYDAITYQVMNEPVAPDLASDHIVDLTSIRENTNPFTRLLFFPIPNDFDPELAANDIRKLKMELELKIAASKCYGFDPKNEHDDIKKTRNVLREKEQLLKRYVIQKEIEMCMERFVSRQEKIAALRIKIADAKRQDRQLKKELCMIAADESDLKTVLQQSLIEQQRELQQQLVHEMLSLIRETKLAIKNEILSAGRGKEEISAEKAEVLKSQKKELNELLDEIGHSRHDSTVYKARLSLNNLG